MPLVCSGVKRNRREVHYHWLEEFISQAYCNVKSGVIECPLGALHPVHHAVPIRVGNTGPAHGDPRVVAYSLTSSHSQLSDCSCRESIAAATFEVGERLASRSPLLTASAGTCEGGHATPPPLDCLPRDCL